MNPNAYSSTIVTFPSEDRFGGFVPSISYAFLSLKDDKVISFCTLKATVYF